MTDETSLNLFQQQDLNRRRTFGLLCGFVLFFGWLWGGWGLLVGAPLIAIVRTIASRVATLSALSEFLSDDGPRTGPRPT